ncbi:hypothetical protein VST7929_01658 [Vibrio stylophorae]|uniref:Lipoprotein n=1 Tax=Vibrio stylophorae TaxID=659351 RepID=A0ABM8ZTY2_9VIBR|nr:hypothetical protein [Vibrio stylophorae]CAH0533783.1 hypothetical protein VST7929_01658 [Vibrio stylophorae]
MKFFARIAVVLGLAWALTGCGADTFAGKWTSDKLGEDFAHVVIQLNIEPKGDSYTIDFKFIDGDPRFMKQFAKENFEVKEIKVNEQNIQFNVYRKDIRHGLSFNLNAEGDTLNGRMSEKRDGVAIQFNR